MSFQLKTILDFNILTLFWLFIKRHTFESPLLVLGTVPLENSDLGPISSTSSMYIKSEVRYLTVLSAFASNFSIEKLPALVPTPMKICVEVDLTPTSSLIIVPV